MQTLEPQQHPHGAGSCSKTLMSMSTRQTVPRIRGRDPGTPWNNVARRWRGDGVDNPCTTARAAPRSSAHLAVERCG